MSLILAKWFCIHACKVMEAHTWIMENHSEQYPCGLLSGVIMTEDIWWPIVARLETSQMGPSKYFVLIAQTTGGTSFFSLCGLTRP